MKRKKILFLLFLLGLISACSFSDSDKDAKDRDSMLAENESADMDSNVDGGSLGNMESKADDTNTLSVKEGEFDEDVDTNRMIIHTAQLDIRVKDFEKTQINIENKVADYDGYVVESSVYRESDDDISGQMVVRVPEEHFQTFLTDAEEAAVDVLSREVSGQDVTEEYVDLESRLKSKQVVEERLLEFMDESEKSEELLKLSDDISTVQEDIEVIAGKMEYLENQSDYATVEIVLHEDLITVPDIDKGNFNTWEKTKKQFADSVNGLLKIGSGFIVFVIGNLPIIMPLFIIGAIVYFVIRRRKKTE